MKKLYFTCALLLALFLFAAPLSASRPLVGIAGVERSSPRSAVMAPLLESHLANVLAAAGIFDLVKPELLREELARFQCMEDTCLLRFARTAKLSLVIRGRIEERGDRVILRLYAFGTDAPYFGKMVYSYRAEIPLARLEMSGKEYSYICEEHAGSFIARLLGVLEVPVYVLGTEKGKALFDSAENISGTFDLFRPRGAPGEGLRPSVRVGRVRLTEGRGEAVERNGAVAAPGDFILVRHGEKSKFLDRFYYGRKKEIVFTEPTWNDTLYTLFFTVPGSATMPVMAPLGYYAYGDFSGLLLWAVNAAPWLYLEYDGYVHRPETYRKRHRDVPAGSAARYPFTLYMLLCGGMPLFVDAFSHHYLYRASSYQERQDLMGNSATALYLSLAGGGGGHFYRGYRSWGYLYFHLNNFMVYSAFREYYGRERYNGATGTYERESDRKGARNYLLLLGLVKAVEITHVLLLRDNMGNGSVTEESASLAPELLIDEMGNVSFGARYAYRF